MINEINLKLNTYQSIIGNIYNITIGLNCFQEHTVSVTFSNSVCSISASR